LSIDNKIRQHWRTVADYSFNLIHFAKLGNAFSIHVIRLLANGGKYTPLNAKRKIARFSSFPLQAEKQKGTF
jgi:hypothetical protein